MSIGAIQTASLATAVEQIQKSLRGATAEQANVTFSSLTRLVAGLQTSARIRQFDLTIDEPTVLGGTDLGPNPVELVLASLGACQEIVYAVYAASMGIHLDKVEVDVQGDLDPRGFYGVAPVNPGFSAVRYQVRIESPASPKHIRELVEEVERRCPVLDILQRSLPVSGTVDLNGASLP